MLGIEATTEGPFTKKSEASYLVNYRFSTLSLLDKAGVELNEASYYKKFHDLSFKVNVPISTRTTVALFGIGGESPYNKKGDYFDEKRNSAISVAGLTFNTRLRENTVINGSFSIAGTSISKDLQCPAHLSPSPIFLKAIEDICPSILSSDDVFPTTISSRPD